MRFNRLTLGGLVGSGVAVVALAVGGAAPADNSAAAGTNAQTTLTAQSAPRSPELLAGRDMQDMHDMHDMFGRMLHGEFVLPKAGGGYQTMVIQRGSVQEVSSSEITLRSADGFRDSYLVGEDTLVNAGREGIGSIREGEQVSVVATANGQNPTAVHVSDVSLMKSLREKFHSQ
ncbi:hypothetical protein [Actinopolymorpha sp. B9G3]|uniref:hypothetical protein n=1 Tax=Actinopolymorpha sp. B9G3 TaxID=3158970 RepID=UPI0032D99D62